ncbi:hypothetical protein BKA62DRAFT_612403 [Auriculariales sp. MPI-PUGE-AT-0066]|nr:hypothetical protein BKA62DRAFT_612403 [Auriculariales sp. MPI-PUGE-AT-0066]
MAPTDSSKPKKKKQPAKKEKIFHPESRKAGQLARTALRKHKLVDAATKRSRKNFALVDKFTFFFHSIPPDADYLPLDELHVLISDVWLARHDTELQTEKAQRRPGRPASMREGQLELIKQSELEEYRTGIEVVDLTHPVNVTLFRRWDEKDAAFLDLLRYIRISSTTPEKFVVSRPGRHSTLKEVQKQDDGTMDTS